MVTVTGLTKTRMLAIEGASIIDGSVVGDNLILEKHNGSTINAGNVRGLQGNPGTTPTVRKYSRREHCSATINANNTVTAVDVPGAEIIVPVVATTDVYDVTAFVDAQTRGATATTLLVDLFVNGVSQAANGRVIFTSPGTPSLRATVGQQWRITGLSAGNKTFKLGILRTGGAVDMVSANATHTTIKVTLSEYV